MMLIVPDALRNEINRRLDAAYAETPEAEVDREQHYAVLLRYFNDHGVLPSFNVARVTAADAE